MERREHYHPEDIESLLQERGFDELLDEERAFVLRHLSGRAEYEAMRALLHNVREDDRRREPIMAEPDRRDDLLAMFRAHRQLPQWRVWLNSVGAFLWPTETKALWRPALALASLALLVTVSVQVMRHEQAADRLAELKTAKSSPAAPVTASAHDPLVDTDTAKLFAMAQTRSEAQAQEQRARSSAVADMAEAPAASVKDFEPMEEMREAEVAEAASVDDESVSREELEVADTALPARALEEGEATKSRAASGSTSHTVTLAELAANQSVANATGKVVVLADAKALVRSATALASASEVIPLFATGW